MDENILFVGPIAEQGGPAIKNKILVTHFQRFASLRLWNTYDRSFRARIGAVLAILCAKEKYIIVAVSRKGRNLLYPVLLLKSRLSKMQYSCIVIGGNAVDSFRTKASVKALRKADLVTVETRGLKEQMQNTYALKNVYWMPNYKELELKEADGFSEARFQSEELRFLFLSSMRDVKGVRVLFQAFQQVLEEGCSASLDYYGPIKSDLDPTLLEKINASEHINYCGSVENQQVLETMRKYQVFIFPTEYSGEGFPAVLVEAQAAGLPIIASDMNDNPEIITHGRNGWIFEHGRGEQLAERIRYCIQHREELQQISKNNLQDVKQYEASSVLEAYRAELGEAGWPV